MTSFLFPLLFVGLLGLTAWAWGEALLRRLAGPDASDRWALSATLGLGLVGQGLFVLGLFGGLEALPMLLFFLVGHVLAAAGGAWTNGTSWTSRTSRFGSWRMPSGLLLGSAPTFALALYPPTGFDATVYHLPYARRFLEIGGLAFLPELRFPVFPQLGELLYLPGMLPGLPWSGDECAQLTQALAFFLGAGVVWWWGEAYGRAVAVLATGLWLGLPLAAWIGAQAYVDVLLALFVVAGFAAWDRQLGARNPRERATSSRSTKPTQEVPPEQQPKGSTGSAGVSPAGDHDRSEKADPPWRLAARGRKPRARSRNAFGVGGDSSLALLAGIFLGFAAATKYLGLFFVAALGCLVLVQCPRGVRSSLRQALLFAAGVMLVALPWYGRIAWHTGNPVFPFYSSVFGESEWTTLHDAELDSAAGGGIAEDVGAKVASGLGDLATLPWDALFRRGRFDFQAPLSPWYLLLVPLGLLALFPPFAPRDPGRRRVVRRSLGVVGLYGLFWLTTVRDLRFWLPALPLFHLAVALVLGDLLARLRLGRRRRRALVLLAGLALVAPGWLYGVYKLRGFGPPPTDEAEHVAFLDARVPGHDAVSTLNARHGAGYGVYGLFSERLRHYARGRYRGDWFGPDRYELVRPLLRRPDELATALRGRGLDHLLIYRGEHAVPLAAIEESVLFERVYAGGDSVVYELMEPPPQM